MKNGVQAKSICWVIKNKLYVEIQILRDNYKTIILRRIKPPKKFQFKEGKMMTLFFFVKQVILQRTPDRTPSKRRWP